MSIIIPTSCDSRKLLNVKADYSNPKGCVCVNRNDMHFDSITPIPKLEAYSVWTDGTNIYSRNGYVLCVETSKWVESEIVFDGIYFHADNVWTDGTNIYHSYGSRDQQIFNKASNRWEKKIWNGLTDFYGSEVWTDGTNIYCYSYVLNKETDTWEEKVWNGEISNFSATNIWGDGTNIYYSNSAKNYVLNKETDTWEEKVWNGYSKISRGRIWTDGTNIYCYSYVLNKETDTWEECAWLKKFWYNNSIGSQNVQTDGNYIYLDMQPFVLYFVLLPATAKCYHKCGYKNQGDSSRENYWAEL